MMKGSIDIATLAIVMVPMSIFLIFSGQQLSKAAIDTSLRSSFELGKNKFKAQNKLYQVLHYRPTPSDKPLYKKIVNLKASNNPDSINSTIQDRAFQVMSADSSMYYEVVINYPDGSKIEASTWDNPDSSWMHYLPDPNTKRVGGINLPSPKKGTITVNIRVLSG